MDELSAAAREILSEMRQADAPENGARERVRRQLAVSLGGAVSATVVSSTSAAATAGAASAVSGTAVGISVAKLVTLVAIGALGGTAVLTPVAFLSEPRRAPAHTAPMGRVVQPEFKPAPRREAPLRSAELAAPPASVVPPPLNPSVVRAPASNPDSVRVNSLGSETRLLAQVRALLQAGRAKDALSLLEQHARSYPNGVLAEEAAASRVIALGALGRSNEAEAERTRFHLRFPRSPLGPRVDRAVLP